ncbi:MAG: hypothetical protein HY018_02415 [Hydrogenophilales bacterium]|nr:hypothetical protein [Hydrogenophilales bacterium]
MNAEHDVGAEAGAAAPADAEARLARNREALRRRLAQTQADQRSGMPGALNELASASVPIVRQAVRQHPYASLTGAALAGALLVRWKPWRRLGGSVLIGWLARQALDLSAPDHGHALSWLLAAARDKQKSNPPR